MKKKPATPASPMASLVSKVKKIKEIRSKINERNKLFIEHDQLMSEVLQYFITMDSDSILINRKLTIGSQTIRLIPFFFDEKKGTIVTKTWKSTPHETFTIE